SGRRWRSYDELSRFVRKVEDGIAKNHQLISWQGFDLEVQGDIQDHLRDLKAAIEQRRWPRPLVSYAQVHDLSAYSSRVASIGIDNPYYSPYIAEKKVGEGWFPENVLPVIVYQPEGETESVAVPVNKAALAELQRAAQTAKAEGRTQVQVPWLPKPMPLQEAEHIGRTFTEGFDDIRGGSFKADEEGSSETEHRRRKKTLVVRDNIQTVD